MNARCHFCGGPKDGEVWEREDAPPVLCFPFFQGVRAVVADTGPSSWALIPSTRIEYVRIGRSPDRNPRSVGYKFSGYR